jgi:GMC oxidoreductase
MMVRLRPCDTSPHRVYVPPREGCQSCICSIPFALCPPRSGACPDRALPRSAWLRAAPAGGGGTRGVGTPAPRVQRGRRRARLERAGWRKKGFQLPLCCFTLPLRDATAVVDPERRLHGIAGRRVADAALMPTVASGHTNAVTIMIGERGADLVCETLRLAA